MQACKNAGLQFRVRVKDKVRVSVRDKVGVRVSDGVMVSTFYFYHISSPQKPASHTLPISKISSALFS